MKFKDLTVGDVFYCIKDMVTINNEVLALAGNSYHVLGVLMSKGICVEIDFENEQGNKNQSVDAWFFNKHFIIG